MQISHRAAAFTESVIREMTRLANRHSAVNLAQGMPDFDTPDEIRDAAAQAIRDGFNQYAITWGAPVLRQAIVDKARSFNRIDCDPDENITVCCGSTECMIAAMLALVNPGDEVIVFQPFYENYGPDAKLSGATPVYVNLRAPDWKFDPDDLRKAFTNRTRAIIVNTPHNPTGKVFNCDELSLIAELCVKHNVWAITDEIYEHIIYTDEPHCSIATLPGMSERTITISGLSKTFSITGWRLGYAIAPRDATIGIRRVHDFLTVGAPHPLQIAAAAALRMPQEYYIKLRSDYARRRQLLSSHLRDVGFEFSDVEGAYYIMTDIRPFGGVDDVQFTNMLVREIGVAVVPGSSFYEPRSLGRTTIRFMFAKKDETLNEAGRRLKALKALRNPSA